jgi:hypothetical protein
MSIYESYFGVMKKSSKKNFSFYVLISSFLTFYCCLSCYGSVEEDANKILDKAGAVMANLDTFVAEWSSEDASNPTKTTMFWNRESDGFVDVRLERLRLRTGETNVHIFNKSGKWFIWGGEALKYDAMSSLDSRSKDNMRQILATKAAGINAETSCTLSETNYDDTLCYLIHQTFSNGKDLAKALEEGTKESAEVANLFQKFGVSAASMVPKAVDYVIGKTNSFTYCRTIYGNDGVRLSSVIYRNMKVNVPLSEDLFKIPTTLKTREFNSQDEMTRYMADTAQHRKNVEYPVSQRSSRNKFVLPFMLLTTASSCVIIFMISRRNEANGKNGVEK